MYLCQPIGKAWLSETAYKEMVAEAERVFPNETGGVFVGYWAVPFHEVVVTAAIGPGPRAVHESDRFEPDPEHQEAEIARCYQESGRLHTYLGDWHTHPDSGPHLSRLDRKTLKTIAGHPDARTPVPIMAVLGGGAPWRFRLWRGNPIRIGSIIVAVRTRALTVKMFQP